jgi:hypothetical protein
MEMKYYIKHKHTHQYLQKWFPIDRFGHWEDKLCKVSKKAKEQVELALGDSIEIIEVQK